MDLSTIFRPADVYVGVSLASKHKALQMIAFKAANAAGVNAAHLLSVLETREALGSTGIGRGIAVPHASLPELRAPRGFILRPTRPLDFEAIDDAPVDLVFLLIFGDEWRSEYLKVLAAIARKAHDATTLDAMRSAEGADGLYASFMAS